MGQLATRKKTISYLTLNISMLIANVFKKEKCFTRQRFSLLNFTYNLVETYLFDTSCCLSTSNFFTTIAALCNNMLLQVNNIANIYAFCSFTQTDLSGNTGFLQWVQRSHLQVVIITTNQQLLVDFDPCC